MNVKCRAIAIIFVLALLVGTAVYYAPSFLAYANKPVKSDAIILFLGKDSSARRKEAHRLLNEGYAGFLIIPAAHQVFDSSNVPLQPADTAKHGSRRAREYPRYYEATHVEVLDAQKMMNSMGLTSAIMVSSPYHMKRIKIICDKTFGEQARYILYVPASYESGMTDWGHVASADVKMVMLECVKIGWFRLYSSFI